MIFFFVYLLRTALSGLGILFLQYLTNWGLMTLVLYLLWSAVSVTYTYIKVLILKHPKSAYRKDTLPSKPPGCCGFEVDTTTWYQKVHWILFTLSGEIAMGICLLYWSLVYNADDADVVLIDIDIVVHAMNAVFSYIDLWVTGIPVRLYHFYILMIFGSSYLAFSGIHYAALVVPNITDPIYPGVLDFGNDPVSSTVVGMLALFVGFPLIHLFFYASYLLRQALLHIVKKNLLKTTVVNKKSVGKDEYDELILT